MTIIMYVSAILAVVIILTIIGVLSRYRKCKPNQVLVVYGKTGGEKKSAKLYHGGAAFVLPIIQSYDVLSMEPMQIDCKLTGALSSQNIRVDVPTTITVAISTNPEIMQNAAERLLGMDTESTENLITDIVYGQMRLIIAEMTIEKLNSDRDEFLDKARKNIDNELNKLGLYLLNINISDIRDEAGYIMNLGKEAESKALNEAQANIEEQEKLGAIKIAVQQKEKETAVANTQKEQEIQIAYTEKEKETVVAETKKEKEVALALTDKEKQIGVAQADRDRADAEAAAHLAKAEAEAKAIQMKLEAEAEGKKKSLMAEADGFKAMVEAAESNPQIAIQYKMVNQWKEIAGEQVKAFEHINLGNITVFDGGQNSTGNFLNNVVKAVAPALGVIDQLPIADTLKKLKGDDKK